MPPFVLPALYADFAAPAKEQRHSGTVAPRGGVA